MDSIGRNDAQGGYYQGGYWRAREKREERERVLKFVLDVTDSFHGDGRIRMLSMPGLSFGFEHRLLKLRGNSQLVCLEKSVSVYTRGRALMPAADLRKLSHPLFRDPNYVLNDRDLPYGTGKIIYTRSRACRGYQGLQDCTHRSHRYLLMDSATYVSMLLTDYGASLQERRAFNERFYLRNAVWLDYTSQLCPSVEETIRNLQFCMELPSTERPEKPVVITVMGARDAFRGDARRIEHVLSLQPRLHYREHWRYVGKGGIPMLTVGLVFRETPSVLCPEGDDRTRQRSGRGKSPLSKNSLPTSAAPCNGKLQHCRKAGETCV